MGDLTFDRSVKDLSPKLSKEGLELCEEEIELPPQRTYAMR